LGRFTVFGDWVFEEYPTPLSNIPQTGLNNITELLAALGLTLTAAGLLIPYLPRKREDV